jgi:micrococcal nuclease
VPGQAADVTEIVDGDTVKVIVAATGAALTVRVLGTDTPEVYSGTECWGPQASQFARDTLAGRTVGLIADHTQDDRDRYDRALRYLILPNGANYSVLAAEAGAARSYIYDTPVSKHAAITAAEQRAQAADAGLWGPPCFGAQNTAEPAPQPEPEPQPDPAGNCAPGYDPCVPPYPPDVDCADVNGPITVTGSDPHSLDGDDDGTACE